MKTSVFPLFFLLIVLCFSNLNSTTAANKNNLPASGTISIYSSSQLFDLTNKWAEQFSQSNPGQSVKVIKVEDSGIADLISKGENICFVSNEIPFSGEQASIFQIVVGREIFVPVISSKNPFLAEIYQKGISREALARSLETHGKMQWGTLLKNGQQAPVRYFILNDEFTKEGVEGYIKADHASMDWIKCEDRDKLISSIQNDPYAIGFCRMTDILQPNTVNFEDNIQLLPIDKNGNGKMDFMENIYANFEDFSRGVWIGKYPKSLTSNIFCVAKTQPSDEIEVAFLQWVLTSGQEFLPVKGYSDLVSSERQSQMNKLIPANIYRESPKETNSVAKLILLLLILAVALSFTLDLIIRRYRNRKREQANIITRQPAAFDEKNVSIPKGLYFDKTHTWAFMEKDGTVKVGIDDFLQHVTGPITSIGMKNPGVRIKKGDQLCILIQKGKHLIIHSPVSGTVKAHNDALSTNSSAINSSPYSEGWVYIIEPSNWLREIELLSMADKYKTWLSGEFTRLKDFLAFTMQAGSPKYAQITLQDGGILKDHVLADLNPEIWEDFQTQFINNVR